MKESEGRKRNGGEKDGLQEASMHCEERLTATTAVRGSYYSGWGKRISEVSIRFLYAWVTVWLYGSLAVWMLAVRILRPCCSWSRALVLLGPFLFLRELRIDLEGDLTESWLEQELRTGSMHLRICR